MINSETDDMSRKHPRIEVSATIEVGGNSRPAVERAPEGDTHIQNISLGGICIQTGEFEEIGTVVDLVINFPDLPVLVVNTYDKVLWSFIVAILISIFLYWRKARAAFATQNSEASENNYQ